MYKDQSIIKFCDDLENKQINMGGGSLIALNLATVNSLIQYIANLTIGKKKYQSHDFELMQLLDESKKIKEIMLDSIDKDNLILEKILASYKSRKEDNVSYQNACKEAVEFGIFVLEKSYDTLCLVDKISKIGNTNLVSDFEIAMEYAYASVKSSITNIKINIKYIEDNGYKTTVVKKYDQILVNSDVLKQQILNITAKYLD